MDTATYRLVTIVRKLRVTFCEKILLPSSNCLDMGPRQRMWMMIRNFLWIILLNMFYLNVPILYQHVSKVMYPLFSCQLHLVFIMWILTSIAFVHIFNLGVKWVKIGFSDNFIIENAIKCPTFITLLGWPSFVTCSCFGDPAL